jgi:hypothetical protein
MKKTTTEKKLTFGRVKYETIYYSTGASHFCHSGKFVYQAACLFFKLPFFIPNPGRGEIILDPEIIPALRDQGIVRPGNHAFRDYLATDNPLGFNSNVIKALCGKSNQ